MRYDKTKYFMGFMKNVSSNMYEIFLLSSKQMIKIHRYGFMMFNDSFKGYWQ